MHHDPVSVIVLVLLLSGQMLAKLWYYVVGGILAGALATALIPKERLGRFLGKRKRASLAVSTVAGIASPLCTFGTVPLFLGLLSRGMPIGPVAAFLVASAALNPQMVVLTGGTLGIRMAVAQIIAVFVMSMIVGRLVSPAHQQNVSGFTDQTGRPDHRPGRLHNQADEGSIWRQTLRTSLGIAEHVILYFLIGILIASALMVLTRGTFFNTILGASKWFAIPLAGLLAIPLYTCGGAALPVLLLGGSVGMSQGAILAFLIVGPATRIAPMVGAASIFTRRAVVLYLVFVLVFALACGLAYESVLRVFPVTPPSAPTMGY